MGPIFAIDYKKADGTPKAAVEAPGTLPPFDAT
jgi:hypothetical protein